MNLREFLEKYNITQKAFALQVGVSRQSIVNYLVGRKMPRMDIARRIERATENRVRMDDLIKTFREAQDVRNGVIKEFKDEETLKREYEEELKFKLIAKYL